MHFFSSKKLFIIFCFIFFFLHANNLDDLSEKEKRKKEFLLKAIFITADENQLDVDLEEAKGVIYKDIDFYFDEADLTHFLEVNFLGKEISKDLLLEIKNKVVKYYLDEGFPLTSVLIPKQKISKGVLRLLVEESALGNLSIESNRYYSDDYYQKYISIEKDDKINENKILDDLYFINLNPFINADIVYVEGEKINTTDVEIYVRERKPFQIFAGIDNTGLDLIGKERYNVGVHLGNLFSLGHLFTYQFTNTIDKSGYYSHIFQYTLPLPWKNLVNLYGGFSSVNSDDIPIYKAADGDGSSMQASIRYRIPFYRPKFLVNEVQLGFDFKRTNTTAEFSNNPELLNNKKVNLTQFVLEYSLNYSIKRFKLDWDIAGFYSPGRMFPDESEKDYNALRKNTKNTYFYALSSLQMIGYLPYDLSASLMYKMQLTTENLLPSEQLGIGGYNSVRGYDERQLSVDNGVILSCELRSMPFNLLYYIISKKIDDSIVLLGFIDYGKGWQNLKGSENEKKSDYIWSLGYGFRYVIDSFFSLRCDFGYKMKKDSNYLGNTFKFHFGTNVNF